ncbi:hypothetical protein VNO78_23699 [Psophocarpus tetragonolobus]|uniref:Uncharacterized protein n=1 Tax=Psophocarpus tetragonolobus TaxID=3891 RepID=A0AAN9XE40_PSOTE
MVTFTSSQGNASWIESAVYASPIQTKRETLWEHIILLRGSITNPWLLMGDFNETTCSFKTRGGNLLPSTTEKFSRCIDDCSLVDLNCVGSRFTWFRNAARSTYIAKRLDIFLGVCTSPRHMLNAFVAIIKTMHISFSNSTSVDPGMGIVHFGSKLFEATKNMGKLSRRHGEKAKELSLRV